MKLHWKTFIILIALCSPQLVKNSQSVIFFETDDPSHNTSEPTGPLIGSGWQWVGQWQHFIGTPIAPNYFITAAHVGGIIGQALVLGGKSHVTTAAFRDPSADLTIWQVREPFVNWAPLCELTTEIGKPFIVFGRGTQRGEEVYHSGNSPKLRGWKWGQIDGQLRWGQNEVSRLETSRNEGILDVFYATFDQDVGSNECHLSTGDSGGPCFIQVDGNWQIAGINYGVDGRFNTSPDGVGFDACLFDRGGLYVGSEVGWSLQPLLPIPRPSGFYATRISVRAAWIRSILDQPLRLPPKLLTASSPEGPYWSLSGALVNETQRTITAPMNSDPLFLKLESNHPISIETAQVFGTNLLVSYLFLDQ